MPTTAAPPARFQTAALGLLAFLILVPVTLPVTLLRQFVYDRFGVTESLASLFMSINMVGALIAAPLAGIAADRLGRRRALVAGALVADALLLFLLTRPMGFAAFLGVRFLEGCAHITALSLLMGLAAHGSSEARRGRVMGAVGAGLTLGVAFGAPLGGFIGRSDPLRPLLAGSALVLAAALVAWLALDERDEAGERRPALGDLLGAVRRHPLLLAPLAFSFADRFTVGFYTTTLSFFLSRIHGLSPPRIGLLIAAFMLPFAALSYPFGRLAERHSRVALMCWGSVAYGIGTASLTLWPLATLPLAMAAIGVTAAVMFVPTLVITTDAAPSEIRSTALGAFNAAGSLGFIVGPVVGGAVSEQVAAQAGWQAGYGAAFAVAGASQIVCVLAALPFLRRLIRSGQTT